MPRDPQRVEEISLLTSFMRQEAGRRWLYNKLAMCHIYATTYRRNALDMAFSEGERNVGLQLVVDLMEASPDLYMQMLKEANRERPRSANPDSAESDDSASGGTSG